MLNDWKQKQFFIFFIILSLSASVASAGFFDWLTGKVTDGTCTDSDCGKNYDVKGKIDGTFSDGNLL